MWTPGVAASGFSFAARLVVSSGITIDFYGGTMSRESLNAIRQVLVEAVESPHFFDLSDGERINWMIERG
jgi:hypothetical protein